MRALKISAWTLGALLLLIVALSGAVLIAGNTDSGRALIERLTDRLTSGRVQLSGLGGSFPAALDLGKLQLSDDRGVWLIAEHLSLRWSPLASLTRHVQVDTLQLVRLHIERTPVTAPSAQGSHNIALPHIDVTHLSVDALELGAQLAGMPVSVAVRGSVHLRSLQDATANVVARRTDGDGHYELQLQFNPARMDARLKLQEPASGPLENLLQLPGLGALSALVELSGPRSAERIQVTIDAGPLRGRAQGTVNLIQGSGDLNYSVEAPAMTLRPGLVWQRVTLQGRWRGTVRTPTADGRLRVDQLQLPGGTQLAALSANLTATGGMLAAHATLDGLVIPGPQPKLLEGAPLKIDTTMRLNEAARPVVLVATHRLFELHAHAVTAGQQSATLELHLPDLAPLAALGGQDVRGDANVKARLTRARTTTRITLDASTAVTGGTAIWAGILGNTGRLQLSAALAGQALTVERMLLTGRAISFLLSGSATRSAASSRTPNEAHASSAAAEELDARWALNLSDLAALSPTLAGTLKVSGRVKGPGNALTADGELTSTLSIRSSPSGTVSAALHAEGLPTAPRGTLEAHGTLDGAPLRLNASLDREKGNALHAVIRQADWKSAHVEGDLASGADMTQARGYLRLRISQLADLQRLLGTNVQGNVAANLVLTPLAPAGGVKSRTHTQLQFEAHDVVAGGLTANAQLTAAGPTDALNLRLAVQLPDLRGEPASLTTAALLNLTARELNLASAEGTYHNQTVRLMSPARVSFANGLSVTGLKLGAQQAVVELEGRVSPAFDLRASVRQVTPALINAFVPNLLDKGTINAEAQLQGSTAAPTGRVHVDAVGMHAANDAAQGLPAVDMHASAQLMGDTAGLDAKLGAGSASLLTLSGRAPLNVHGALDLKLGGKLDVGLINPLLEAHGQHAAGELSIDTTVTGVATAPEIGGTIRLARGNLRDYKQGISLSDITAQIVGSHGTLRIVSLTARAAPGTVSVTGTIGVLQPGLPVDLKLTARNAQPIASNIVTANLDADLQVSGTARERLNVGGKIHIKRADIQIPSGLPPNVAVLDVRRPGQEPPAPNKKPLVIGLDITVQAPRQILVQGRGLDAELGGELHLRGTTDSPVVTGGFDLQRGAFSLGSSHLTFTTGTVTFSGSGLKGKIDPTLDFTAQSAVADVTVTLRITGLADSPKIELTSTPELPQDEILARLLFGRPAAQLSALQVAQIGAALATLSGGGGGLNPLAKIQKTLGLDRLSVGGGTSTGTATTSNTTNAGASIEAGRYVSSRVYVAVRQSTTGVSQLEVDVDLSKHLRLQTRLGNGTQTAQGTTPENDPGSSVGVAYQFEY